jgi:hypothetical protein
MAALSARAQPAEPMTTASSGRSESAGPHAHVGRGQTARSLVRIMTLVCREQSPMGWTNNHSTTPLAMQVWRESGAGQFLPALLLQVHLSGLQREKSGGTASCRRLCVQHHLQGVAGSTMPTLGCSNCSSAPASWLRCYDVRSTTLDR